MRCMTERRISSIDKASAAISSLPSELITFSSSPELTSAASFESFIILPVSRRVYHMYRRIKAKKAVKTEEARTMPRCRVSELSEIAT